MTKPLIDNLRIAVLAMSSITRYIVFDNPYWGIFDMWVVGQNSKILGISAVNEEQL